jgi:hypothetical protein
MGRQRPWLARAARLGGIARRTALTPEERTASARQAVLARWKRTPKAARSEAARKAVLARWAKAKVRTKSGGR